MVDNLSNPHDKFFKDLFSRPEVAHDFLQYYLPSEIVTVLDLSKLEITKDSFIDPALQTHFSDVLYKIALKEGQSAYIYILFEHKSYPDPLVAFQLLRYMVRIWEQSLKQDEQLVPILPLVLYHGAEQWTINQQFSELLAIPDALRAYVPDYRYWLFDLGQQNDQLITARIGQAVVLQMGLLSLKYIHAEDVGEQLVEILNLAHDLSNQETAREYIQTILRYMSTSAKHASKQDVQGIVLQVIEQGDNLMATIFEDWLEQGREQGLEQGLEQGREEGLEQGREAALMILRRYLATRFNLGLDHFDLQLATLDLTALTQLSKAAFEAGSLADFEATLTSLTKDSPADNQSHLKTDKTP